MLQGNQAPHLAESSTSTTPTDACPEWFPLVALFGGITSLSLAWLSYPLIALVVSVPSLVFGIRSLSRPKHEGRGLAIAGVVCASLSLVIAFLATFSGWVGSDSAAIERTLEKIQEVGREAGERFPNDPVSQSRFVATHLRDIDTATCPPEFILAFDDYVYAWEAGVPYFEADQPATWFLEGFVGGLANDISGLGLSSQQARVAAEKIRENFRALNRTAVAYGARLPKK